MLVRILDSAHNDIRDGYWFYEDQEPGVGDYFSDTLYGEIESLALYAGIHNRRGFRGSGVRLQKRRGARELRAAAAFCFFDRIYRIHRICAEMFSPRRIRCLKQTGINERMMA